MSQFKKSWTRVQVGNICEVVRGSSPRPIADQRYFKGGTIPWIKIADATKSGRYLYDTREKVNEFGASFSRLLPRGSLIVAASGTLGYTQMLGVPGCIHDGWLHLSKFKGVDRIFLYYWLKCQVKHFTNAAYGAAIQNINTAIMRESEIALPPLDEQRRIASILSAYDDLIENNTRRIAILEEMASRIYEEWFVRFRFPGHEGVRMVESELGLVPEGWAVVAASHAIQINPTTKVPRDGLKRFLAMNCLSNGAMLIDNPSERDGNSGSKFRNGDTLFARITPCLENGKTGFVQFLPTDEAFAFGSTEFIVLRSRTLTPEFVYLLARSDPFRENAIKSMSGASGRQRVREACFNTFLMANPDSGTLEKFETVVRPMFKLIQSLAMKNANLRTTRDLLLPKLISGELDVSTLPEASHEPATL